jgi:hypothetical protein
LYEALFFYVTGMNTSGLALPTAKTLRGRNAQALFEDGLDGLIAGARPRAEEDLKSKRPPRSR